MKDPIKKLKGRKGTEMTKLKGLWLKMPDEERAYWQELFVSNTPIPEIREEIFTKLGVKLNFNWSWCRFRDWELEQRDLYRESERMEEDERQIIKEFGDKWTLEKVRKEVLKKSYARTLRSGNFKLGLATVREDMRVKKIALDERKVELLEKKAAQADATDTVLAEAHLTSEERAQRI